MISKIQSIYLKFLLQNEESVKFRKYLFVFFLIGFHTLILTYFYGDIGFILSLILDALFFIYLFSVDENVPDYQEIIMPGVITGLLTGILRAGIYFIFFAILFLDYKINYTLEFTKYSLLKYAPDIQKKIDKIDNIVIKKDKKIYYMPVSIAKILLENDNLICLYGKTQYIFGNFIIEFDSRDWNCFPIIELKDKNESIIYKR